MVQKNDRGYYFYADKRDLAKVDYDFGLCFWYAQLKDYAKRFKKDELGFVRIPPHIYTDDLMVSRKKFQRYNKKLEDKGLIKIDKVHRGGRTWAGFKLV